LIVADVNDHAEPIPVRCLPSHSAKDKGGGAPAGGRLRNDGLKVWFDEWVSSPATASRRRLRKAGALARAGALHVGPCVRLGLGAVGLSAVASARRPKAGTFRFRDPLNRSAAHSPAARRRPIKAPWRSSFASTGARRTASRNQLTDPKGHHDVKLDADAPNDSRRGWTPTPTHRPLQRGAGKGTGEVPRKALGAGAIK